MAAAQPSLRPQYTAGLVLYSVLPRVASPGKEVVVLLGMEKSRSPHFSDFTGYMGRCDEGNPMLAAAREAHEETMGAFYHMDMNDSVPLDTRPDEDEICEKGVVYFLEKAAGAVMISDTFTDQYHRHQCHTFFYVQVPFVPAATLIELRGTLKRRGASSQFTEKADFCWVRLDEIFCVLKAKEEKDCFLREVHGEKRKVKLLKALVRSLSLESSISTMEKILRTYSPDSPSIPPLDDSQLDERDPMKKQKQKAE